jgi:hypothetical protein
MMCGTTELRRSLPDLWSGPTSAACNYTTCEPRSRSGPGGHGQRAWLRQLDPPPTKEHEDAVLRTIARLDGTPFRSTTRLDLALARRHLVPRRGSSRFFTALALIFLQVRVRVRRD